MSSSFPILPIPVEQKYPKLPDCQQVSMERELRSNPFTPHSHFGSNNGSVGPLFSSDLHHSSISPHVRQPTGAPFIAQSPINGASLPSIYPSHTGSFQPSSSNYPSESTEIGWSQEPLFLEYPVDVNAGSNQIKCDSVVASDDLTKQNEWLSDLMIDDWINDTSTTEPQPKVSYTSK